MMRCITFIIITQFVTLSAELFSTGKPDLLVQTGCDLSTSASVCNSDPMFDPLRSCGNFADNEQRCCQVGKAAGVGCFKDNSCTDIASMDGCFCAFVPKFTSCLVNQGCTSAQIQSYYHPHWLSACYVTPPSTTARKCSWPNNIDVSQCYKQAPPSGSCVDYMCGGSTGVHYYACCDGTTKTFQSASSGDYCNPSNKYFQDSCGYDIFSCPTQLREQCDVKCQDKDFINQMPGFCWVYSTCFKSCCVNNGVVQKITTMANNQYSIYQNTTMIVFNTFQYMRPAALSDQMVYYQVMNPTPPSIANALITTQQYDTSKMEGSNIMLPAASYAFRSEVNIMIIIVMCVILF